MPATRLFNTRLLGPEHVEPSRPDFRVVGAFNPGAVAVGEEVVLTVRVAERPRERRDGMTPLPRWDPDEGLTADWVADKELEFLDPRVVRLKGDGTLRLTQASHVRVFRSADGRNVPRKESARLDPRGEYETYGVEDARIVRLGDTYRVTYVAVSPHGAATALASTMDFEHFDRHGIIFWPENKDVVLFPERIDGSYVALHRPNLPMGFGPPRMWLARSPDLLHWGGHVALHAGSGAWEGERTGAGAPPVRTVRGWLEIYHGKAAATSPGQVGTYSAGLLLLDARTPERVLHRSREPVLVPEEDFERRGFVPNVVFPTGVVRRGDRLLVYYGAADTCTAVVELSMEELLSAAE